MSSESNNPVLVVYEHSVDCPSQTFYIYSAKKNVRLSFKNASRELFDRIVGAFAISRMLVDGDVLRGAYRFNPLKTKSLIDFLSKTVATSLPRAKGLISYLGGLEDGDAFFILSADLPDRDRAFALYAIDAVTKGGDIGMRMAQYQNTLGALHHHYLFYAFGHDGCAIKVGNPDNKSRVCRFCGKKFPEVSFKDDAHAISKGLGNDILFCNEECDDCNNKLSKVESNLMRYLDVRRALGGVLSRNVNSVPSIDGKGFVIRGDETNTPVLYLEREFVGDKDKTGEPFWVKLESTEIVSHQGIYKALCKIVLDLLPATEMKHFKETVAWINGSILDTDLPYYMASYDQGMCSQPTVDIFITHKPGTEPYCTAILHVLDARYVYILPEVDVDKWQFMTDDCLERHFTQFCTNYRGTWQKEDTSEYDLSNPWTTRLIDPKDPSIKILPASDKVFTRYVKEKDGEEVECTFPEFSGEGISVPEIADFVFKRNYSGIVGEDDLRHVSVNYNEFVWNIDKSASTIEMFFSFDFCDSSNTTSFFSVSFKSLVHLDDIERHIVIGEYFSIDYRLRDYLMQSALCSADNELLRHTGGTDLEPITLLRTIEDRRALRHISYRVPIGDRVFFVKDSNVHH